MRIARFYRRVLERFQQPRVRFGFRRRLLRFARIAAGFVLTLAFLAVVGAVFVAVQSRVRLDPPGQALETEPEGSTALQASERIFAQRHRDGAAGEALSPSGRRARDHETFAGAEAAAIAFLDEVRLAGDETHAALDDLQDKIGARAGVETIAQSVSAFSAAISTGSLSIDWSAAARRRLIYLAAMRLEAQARALSAFVLAGRDGPIARDAERQFFRAKGEAYAWALILRGAAHDWGEVADGDALAALDRAALYQPLFLFNGPADSWIVPNHLTYLALSLEIAADALQRRVILGLPLRNGQD